MSFRSKKTRSELLAKDTAAAGTTSQDITGSTLIGLQHGSVGAKQTENQTKTSLANMSHSKQQHHTTCSNMTSTSSQRHTIGSSPNAVQPGVIGVKRHMNNGMNQTESQPTLPPNLASLSDSKKQQHTTSSNMTSTSSLRHNVGSTPMIVKPSLIGGKQHMNNGMKQTESHLTLQPNSASLPESKKQQHTVGSTPITVQPGLIAVKQHMNNGKNTSGSVVNSSGLGSIGVTPIATKHGNVVGKHSENLIKVSQPQTQSQKHPESRHDYQNSGSTSTVVKDHSSGIKLTMSQPKFPGGGLSQSKHERKLPSTGFSFGPFNPSGTLPPQPLKNNLSSVSNSGNSSHSPKSTFTVPVSQPRPQPKQNPGKRPVLTEMSGARRDHPYTSSTSTNTLSRPPPITLSRPKSTTGEATPGSPFQEPLFDTESQNSDEDNEDIGIITKMSKSAGGGCRKSGVPDWPDDIACSINEKVLTIDAEGNQNWVTGSIQPRDVSKQCEVRYYVNFNEFKQPMRKGGSMLVRYLGYLAKVERFCPIGECSWHHVNKLCKAELIVLIRSKFVIPNGEIYDKGALKRVDKHWRQYKYSLKKSKFLPKMKANKPIEDIYSDVPPGHPRNSWMKLVDYWSSTRGQELSKMGKSARAFQDHLHTSGGTSFANRRADFVAKNKREPSNLEFFDLTHRRKDGDFVDNTVSKEFLELANAKVDERLGSSSPSKSLVDVENEVFDELMYEDGNPKRPVGYGFGIIKGDVFGVHAELRKRGCGSSTAHDNTLTNFLLTKQNQVLHQKNKALESTVQQNQKLIHQILHAFATGQVSQEFLDVARQSVQHMGNSQGASHSREDPTIE